MARRDLLTRLADAGEEAISRLGDAPGGDRLLGVANNMRDRVDELQKKVRGLDELEKRVAALERRVAAQEKGGATTRKRAAAPRKAAPKKPKTTRTSTRRTGGGSPG